MKAPDLPESIRPERMAGAGAMLQGEISLSSFGRLCKCLLESEGSVRVDLQFTRDERRQVQIDGSLNTQVSMVCQRCLRPARLALQAPVALTLVAGEELVDRVAEDRDALVLDATAAVSLASLLEDELMLALPAVARHADGGCDFPDVSGAGEAVSPDASTRRPFAVLEALQKGPARDNEQNEPPGDD